jgi:hypothetical protein
MQHPLISYGNLVPLEGDGFFARKIRGCEFHHQSTDALQYTFLPFQLPETLSQSVIVFQTQRMLYFYASESKNMIMMARRKILIVIGIAVAILIGMFTGVFGMAVPIL